MTSLTSETPASPQPVPAYSKNAMSEGERRFMRPVRAPKKVAYEFTRDPGLLHQYFRLREEMFISVWSLQHFSGQKDEFDDISEILIARQGLQTIAGMRLTISALSHRQPLPVENAIRPLPELFPELNLAECSYGEISRLAILPEFRSGALLDGSQLIVKRAIAEGAQYVFNMAPLPLARSYRQMMQLFDLVWNIRTDIEVPDRDEYEGIKMVLSVMDLTQFAPKPSVKSAQRQKQLVE